MVDALEGERMERAVLALHHTDSAASIDYQNFVLHIMHINTNNKRHEAAFIFQEIFINVNFGDWVGWGLGVQGLWFKVQCSRVLGHFFLLGVG